MNCKPLLKPSNDAGKPGAASLEKEQYAKMPAAKTKRKPLLKP